MAYTTINDPSAHFQSQIYTGNGSTQSITNQGNSNLKPDFMWIKDLGSANDHKLSDSNRGSTYTMESNTNEVEYNDTNAVTSFNTNGFSLGNNTNVNDNSAPNVAMQWKANGGTTASNSDGSITATVQANTTAGFSIISYTGTGSNGTIGHGLSKAPEYWVVKPRTNVSDNQWFVCHKDISYRTSTDYADYFIHWDTNGGKQDNALMWNDTKPTATTISLGTKPGTNDSGGSFVCYAWHSVKGYSKFGGYDGNGQDDGPFVYCGFKPALVWFKRADGNAGWFMFNKDKPKFNVMNQRILTNTNAALDTSNDNRIDFLSNGFKLRDDSADINTNTAAYMFMAWAQNPLVASNNVAATTRGVQA